MRRRWALSLGTAVLGLCVGSVRASEPETIAYLPRALPGQRLTPPVVGIAKASALYPPANDVPAPPTTPPAFTPRDPSICSLCDAPCNGWECDFDGCKHYYAGVGFYYVQPFWDQNPAYFHYGVTGNVPTAGGEKDFRHDYELVPVAWIGCTGCGGLGARARWWKYDQTARDLVIDASDDSIIDSAGALGLRVSSTEDNAAARETLAFDSDLEISVVDLEVTQELPVGCWWLSFSAGGRYAELSQRYDVFRANNAGAVIDVLFSQHKFDGAGLTASIAGHRPLGLLGLAFYGSARGSLLYGHAEQSAHVRVGSTRDAFYAHEDLLPITELELGLEWHGHVGCCELFVQTGLVSQAWFGAGNASRSGNPAPQNVPFRSGSIDDANLGFFGGTVMAGIRY